MRSQVSYLKGVERRYDVMCRHAKTGGHRIDLKLASDGLVPVRSDATLPAIAVPAVTLIRRMEGTGKIY